MVSKPGAFRQSSHLRSATLPGFTPTAAALTSTFPPFRPAPPSATWRRALVVLAIVASLLAGLGMRQPNPADEPRFVLAARSMVESGQWLLPHRGSEL